MESLVPNRNSPVNFINTQGFPKVPSSEAEVDTFSEKPTTPLASRFNDYWVWEVTSCIGSLVCLSAIIEVLLYYTGKTVPQLPYRIIINSPLSLLSQRTGEAGERWRRR
ncbi:hypothetical protein BBP40_001273 [Aspergillus hancockii]|nr:hypothetical protein BBP40_001273 [Aspergillus hancockii]